MEAKLYNKTKANPAKKVKQLNNQATLMQMQANSAIRILKRGAPTSPQSLSPSADQVTAQLAQRPRTD